MRKRRPKITTHPLTLVGRCITAAEKRKHGDAARGANCARRAARTVRVPRQKAARSETESRQTLLLQDRIAKQNNSFRH